MTARGPHGRGEPRVKNWVWGAVLLVVLALGSFVAYTKELPFSGEGYTLHATFENAATLRTNSPVRIAGVNVGEVTEVTPKGDAAEVTFTVKEEGQPIHDDAQIEIRPRLFLEGNFFLDVQPGSPSAPELPDGGDIAVTQTSTAVQLDEVLTALQSDSREDLKVALDGYGTTLTYEPTAADDETQDPDVHGETAAEALNDTFEYGGPAGRDTAIVQDALLGQKPHDLSGLIRSTRDTVAKLEGHESELQGLITNFNVTAGALAAEQANVSASVRELAPTLEIGEPSLRHLSDSLPPLRALARVLEPSVRELPGTIRAAGPWIDQTNLLLRDSELGGLARLLGDSAKPLARTTRASLDLLPELDLLSRCGRDVLAPTGDIVVNDAFSTGEPNFQEFFFGASDLAGEGQGFDGNGFFQRLQSGGGPVLVGTDNPLSTGQPGNLRVYGNAIEEPDGVQPAVPAGEQPPFRTDVPCHTNAVPNVNGPAGAVAPSDLVAP
jgi:phospholipid/cholesterol/gamma-HCH transport system substrate-binding protein